MISPTTFEQFVEPDLGDLINKTKAAGKYTMMHICGNTTPILPKIKAMAPHAFSLEAKVDLGVAMEFDDFRGTRFTRLTDPDGKPWFVAKGCVIIWNEAETP